MDLIIQYFGGKPFVSNPYSPGTSLRLDIFERQFTILVHGSMKLAEKPGHLVYVYGYVQVGQCGLLDEILPIAMNAVQRDKYVTPAAVLSFYPKRISVSDRQGHLVIAGRVDRERCHIEWVEPCRTVEEEKVVLAQIQLLRSQSTFHPGWKDLNFFNSLDTDVDLLRGRLVHTLWRAHIRALLGL